MYPGAPGAPGAPRVRGVRGVREVTGVTRCQAPVAGGGWCAVCRVARAWFAFFYWIWRVPLPQAPYGAMVQKEPPELDIRRAGPALRSGIRTASLRPGLHPLGDGSLGHVARRLELLAGRLLEIAVVFGAPPATVGAFRIWWGGSASPGRPLTSGLLLLAVPIAFAFHAAPMGSVWRAAQHLLLWASLGITGIFSLRNRACSRPTDGTGHRACSSTCLHCGRALRASAIVYSSRGAQRYPS